MHEWPLASPSWELSLSPSNTSSSSSNQQTPTFSQDRNLAEGPYCNTRSRASKTERLFPLREVPTAGMAGGVGFVNAPLMASEVWGFKKEIGNLVEDPVGISNQIDQFLGPNIYTWSELHH